MQTAGHWPAAWQVPERQVLRVPQAATLHCVLVVHVAGQVGAAPQTPLLQVVRLPQAGARQSLSWVQLAGQVLLIHWLLTHCLLLPHPGNAHSESVRQKLGHVLPSVH